MKPSVRLVEVATCVSLFFLCVSCGAKISNKESDPSFNPTEMVNGGLAILGCSSIVPQHPEPLELSKELSTHLRRALLDETIDVNIVAWGDVRRALGEDMMRECLTAYDSYGSLDKAMIDRLAPLVGPLARYVVVHRLESDVVELSDQDNKEQIDGEWVVKNTTLKTERTLTGSFSVYDLRTGTRVWNATIEGDVTTKRTIKPDEDHDIGGWVGTVVDVVDAMDEIFGDDDMPYPQPATNSQVMDKLYKKVRRGASQKRLGAGMLPYRFVATRSR